METQPPLTYWLRDLSSGGQLKPDTLRDSNIMHSSRSIFETGMLCSQSICRRGADMTWGVLQFLQWKKLWKSSVWTCGSSDEWTREEPRVNWGFYFRADHSHSTSNMGSVAINGHEFHRKNTLLSCDDSKVSFSISHFPCGVGGRPWLHFFILFLLTPHFYYAIQACMKQSTPVPKSQLFCFWDWKGKTSTVAILLQGYPQTTPPERCCSPTQAVAEPV
jgi:hypothetical protein